MQENSRYVPEDKMITLIADNFKLIQVLSRFGIPMGFGDSTVKEVCDANNVDGDTFLTVINFLMDDLGEYLPPEKLNIHSLLHFLKQSHVYFLEFCLPLIRRELIDAIEQKDSDVSFLLIKLFDEFVSEVSAHMAEEEAILFDHVKTILAGNKSIHDKIVTYSSHHESVGSKLKEVKKIIIKYCPADSKTNLLNSALYDIYLCEEDLKSHCKIEDHLLLPAIKHLEKKGFKE